VDRVKSLSSARKREMEAARPELMDDETGRVFQEHKGLGICEKCHLGW
jgi:hypothetical protein